MKLEIENISEDLMSFILMSRRSNSSFIKNVMDQVKKEVDHDPKMKKAWEEFAANKKANESKFQGTKVLNDWKNGIENLKNNESLNRSIKSVKDSWSKASSVVQPIASKIGESVEMRAKLDKIANSPAVGKIKSATESVSATISSVTTKLGLNPKSDGSSMSSYERWKRTRDAAVRADATEKAKVKVDSEAENVEGAGTTPDQRQSEPVDGLVVSSRGNSSWDRFGANMRDMPFLNAFYNNPLLESLFGETEISASIRQMREEVDSSFNLEEFVDEIERIVVPRFVEWYLEGNAKKLKPHCGEAAFAAVNASIGARETQKLRLDTNVLSGPTDLELKAAKSGSLGEAAAGTASPLFVFTFNMQQINCLRDHDNNVVEGAVDDIRQLFYAIAVQRNPKANTSNDLEFPWQVQEIAILGNQPSW